MLDSTKRKTQMLFALLALPLVAGFDLSPGAQHELPSPAEIYEQSPVADADMDFHRSLAAAYFNLSAQSAHSLQDRQIFVRKALTAQNGETPEPARLEEWVLSDEQRIILAQARNRLLAHLRADTQAESKTTALTSFDCWVAQAEQAIFVSHTHNCRSTFERAVGIAPHDHHTAQTTAHGPEEAYKVSG